MRLIGKAIFKNLEDIMMKTVESDIVPPVSKTFWCIYGHSWIQT
jgi:hypothetical protein